MIKDFPTIIKTERLEMRQLEPTLENAALVFDALKNEDPEDFKFNPTTAFDPQLKKNQIILPESVEDMLETMKEKTIWCTGDTYNDPGATYYIFLDDKLIGFRRIHWNESFKTLQSSEAWLVKSARHNGYAKESMDAIEKLAFVDFEANRITRQCNAMNVQSAKSIERSGFHLDGIARQSIVNPDGYFGDNMMWSKLKSEYKADA